MHSMGQELLAELLSIISTISLYKEVCHVFDLFPSSFSFCRKVQVGELAYLSNEVGGKVLEVLQIIG